MLTEHEKEIVLTIDRGLKEGKSWSEIAEEDFGMDRKGLEGIFEGLVRGLAERFKRTYISTKEIASLLGVTGATVRSRCREAGIKPVKISKRTHRWRRSDIEDKLLKGID